MPKKSSLLGFSCALLITLVAPAPTQAEELHTRFFRDLTVGSGVHFQHWKGEGDLSVREFSVPLTLIVPVSKRLSLDVVSGSGFAALDRGTSSSLNGLTDTKLRASYIVGDEVALLTAGVSTPTGKTELGSEEQEVSNYLAQNALGFRTANFGQGLDLNVGVATARKLGEMVLGLGASYLLKGQFTPHEGGPEYKPGSEVSLTGGVDRKVLDGDGKVALDVVYTLYGEDQRDGAKAFQSGNKILAQALGMCKAGGMDWRLQAIERSKGKNTSFAGGSESEFSNGNQFETSLAALRPSKGALAWRGLVDLKVYGDNEFGRGQATIYGIGPGLRLKLSPARTLDLNVKLAHGTIDDATVTGIEFSGGIWIRL